MVGVDGPQEAADAPQEWVATEGRPVMRAAPVGQGGVDLARVGTRRRPAPARHLRSLAAHRPDGARRGRVADGSGTDDDGPLPTSRSEAVGKWRMAADPDRSSRCGRRNRATVPSRARAERGIRAAPGRRAGSSSAFERRGGSGRPRRTAGLRRPSLPTPAPGGGAPPWTSRLAEKPEL